MYKSFSFRFKRLDKSTMDSSEGYRAEKRFRTGEVRDVCTVNCSRILNFMSVRWSGGVEREIERREKGNTSNRRTGEEKKCARTEKCRRVEIFTESLRKCAWSLQAVFGGGLIIPPDVRRGST